MTTTKKALLTDALPAKVRKYAYSAYALAVVVVGVWGVIGHVPDQVPVVLAAIGAALGVTAASNVKPNNAPRV